MPPPYSLYSPISLAIPAHTRGSPVSPIIPAHTQNRGVGEGIVMVTYLKYVGVPTFSSSQERGGKPKNRSKGRPIQRRGEERRGDGRWASCAGTDSGWCAAFSAP